MTATNRTVSSAFCKSFGLLLAEFKCFIRETSYSQEGFAEFERELNILSEESASYTTIANMLSQEQGSNQAELDSINSQMNEAERKRAETMSSCSIF